MTITWEAAGGSDVGRLRTGNEDSLRMDPIRGIFMVADGMGGHAAGEIASELAASAVESAVSEALDSGARGRELDEALGRGFRRAYAEIVDCGRLAPHTRGMGTTLTTCVILGDGTAHIGHIGDSRLYLMRAGAIEQLTRDHTWVQREIDAGRLTIEAARDHPLSHVVTRVLSEDVEPELDLGSVHLLPGDLLVIATDGLYNMLDDCEIQALLVPSAPLEELADRLIDAANDAGGADNVTVVVVRISEA